MPTPELEDDRVAEMAETLRLLGEPNRLRIALICLAGPHTVGALAAALGVSLSLTSHHLRLLKAARLLRAERRGRQMHYALLDGHVRRVLTDLFEHVGECAEDSVSTVAPLQGRVS